MNEDRNKKTERRVLWTFRVGRTDIENDGT